jgi:hypothetical protein
LDFFNTLNRFNSFFKKSPFFYWHESSLCLGNTQFRKHNIRDIFIKSLNNN